MASRNHATAPTVHDDDVGPELLASEIVAVASAAKKLLASRLTKRALLILIKDQCPKVPLSDIQTVLDCAAQLENVYIKKPQVNR